MSSYVVFRHVKNKERQMTQLQVRKGSTMKLPPSTTGAYTAGLGWDPAAGQDEVDLDLWVIGITNDGSEPRVISWANQDWYRPDLGTNSEGSPWVATPELDVIYQGDDRTGQESDGGYDENAIFDLAKTPANVVKYAIFATNYDDPEVDPPVKLFGHATNVIFGVKDPTDRELVVKLVDEHAFDVTVLLCTIDRQPDGSWSMTAVQSGYTDSIIKVASSLGAKFGS